MVLFGTMQSLWNYRFGGTKSVRIFISNQKKNNLTYFYFMTASPKFDYKNTFHYTYQLLLAQYLNQILDFNKFELKIFSNIVFLTY